MNDLYAASDRLHLADVADWVYVELVGVDGLPHTDLSVTDVESIYEWCHEWLRNRDLRKGN